MSYISGEKFGTHPNSKVHVLANIVGKIRGGENCRIDAFVTITGNILLGKNCHIGVGACLFGSDGIIVCDDSGVSPGAKIFTGSFDAETMYLGNPMVEESKTLSGPVFLGNRVIIGANSVVLPNARVADDTCVGALSLVKGEISGGLWAGIPAKRKK